MNDPLLSVLVFTTVLLSVVIIAFIVLLIAVLLMVRRSLKKLDMAIDHVEDTAIRSLTPFLSFRSMFSDVGSMVQSVRSWITLFDKKSKRMPKSRHEHTDLN